MVMIIQKRKIDFKIYSILLIVILSMVISYSLKAEQLKEGHVFDDANILTAQEVESIRNHISLIESDIKMDIIVVTTNNTDGLSSQEYADNFFDSHGFGVDEKKNGALLLVDMFNREVYISTSGKMISYLTDTRIQDIIDVGYENVVDEKYANGILSMIDEINSFVKKGIPDGAYTYNADTGEVVRYKKLSVMDVMIAFGISVVLFIITYLSIVKSYRMKTVTGTYLFRENTTLKLSNNEDQFINKVVTFRKIQKSSGDGGGLSGGGSTIHTSSRGASHGGGGRSF